MPDIAPYLIRMLRAVLVSALPCALVACGAATPSSPSPVTETEETQETRTAETSEEGSADVPPHPAPDMVATLEPVTSASPMTAEQRTAIGPLLSRYGSGWRLENIEARYTVGVIETATEYTLQLTALGGSGLTAIVHAGKDGRLSSDALSIPPGPELTAAQLADAERVLRAVRTAWVNPYEGDTTVIELRGGVGALLGDTPRASRMRDGAAVFYTRAEEHGPLLAVVVDLEASRLSEVTWYDVPPGDNGLLPAEDIAAIDEAMRLQGDFGVYGSVSEGLVALARDQRVIVRRAVRPGVYSVSVSSPSGHGHHLSFTVDVATRTLDGVAAGHMVSASPD